MLSYADDHQSDGIIGLGDSSASVQKVPTFVDNLAAMGLISRRLFAINLQRAKDTGVNRNNGQISFGFVYAGTVPKITVKRLTLVATLPNSVDRSSRLQI